MQITEQIIQRIARQVFNQMFPSSLRQSGAIISGSGGSAQYAAEAGHAATADSAVIAATANAVAWDNVTSKPSTFAPPLAANGTRGGIQIGFTTNATQRNYAVQLSSEKAYVNVPWTDHYDWSDITNKPAIPVASTDNEGYAANADYAELAGQALSANSVAWSNISSKPSFAAVATSGSYEDLENVPSTFAPPLATSNVRGGIQIGFTTNATQRNYAVQLSSEKAYVNVPWTDHYDWSDITNKPAQATRWPAWSEVTSKPTSKSAWGQTYLNASSEFQDISGNMSSVGNITFSASGKSIGGLLYFDTTNSRIGLGTPSPSYKLHVAGDIYATGGVSCLSDLRKKDVLTYQWAPCLSMIADAPIIRYIMKDDEQKRERIGSVAQYWQKVMPETVNADAEGTLSMNYGEISLVSVIAMAREVKRLKAEIEQLKKK